MMRFTQNGRQFPRRAKDRNVASVQTFALNSVLQLRLILGSRVA